MMQADATRCTAICHADLGCGHACQHRCGECLQAVIKQNTAEGKGAPMQWRAYFVPPSACMRTCATMLVMITLKSNILWGCLRACNNIKQTVVGVRHVVSRLWSPIVMLLLLHMHHK